MSVALELAGSDHPEHNELEGINIAAGLDITVLFVKIGMIDTIILEERSCARLYHAATC
jgi:hypothetical protein